MNISFAHYVSRVQFHAKPGFFNIFSGDPNFDALNLELFQICLVISQSLGEGTP